ncbi:hypothetical protein CEV33_3755 [Brucella grignonensis]|uniref:Uncharacterized protein n=1 Tax=Brucella grignonensis TaxID=94627 RepID=A0A256EY22_9HYPH|nr:hypothetical protein CEV33_3755 [Brucella grignonensis]
MRIMSCRICDSYGADNGTAAAGTKNDDFRRRSEAETYLILL